MGIECFISEESLRVHKEYLSVLRMKKQACQTRREEKQIENEIRSHELYFDSFRQDCVPCSRIKAGFASENHFCFLLSEYIKNVGSGFLYIYPMPHSPFVGYGIAQKHLLRAVLAIDLCEHAYFIDYGFDFSAYVRAALSHLDFSRLK